MYNIIENRERVIKGEKIRSTPIKNEVAVTLYEANQKEFSRIKRTKENVKRIEVGLLVCVYDMNGYDEKVFNIVRQQDADILNGKLIIETPVGEGVRMLKKEVYVILKLQVK